MNILYFKKTKYSFNDLHKALNEYLVKYKKCDRIVMSAKAFLYLTFFLVMDSKLTGECYFKGIRIYIY